MKQIKVKCPAKTTSTLGEQSELLEMRCPELVSGSHQLRVKCPAKINLTLEVLNKREDGFHNIQSVMQTINLFDVLTIQVEKSDKLSIKLTGNSDEIPYDQRNLVYKAILLFIDSANLQACKIRVHIEKNIPIAAGLAGGSTDAAGVIWGLNELFEQPFSREEIHSICAKLGSDLNFCLEGGCQLATSRGEVIEKLPFVEFDLALIKPKSLGISAKEAYVKYSMLQNKPKNNITQKLVEALKTGIDDVVPYLQNDLELGLIDDYAELREIKDKHQNSLMSGSGSTFFIVDTKLKNIENGFWFVNGLKSINNGVCLAR